MKLTLQSTKYAARNFLYLFPLAVIPAFFLSFTIARKELFLLFEAFKSGSLANITFRDIFQAVSIFNFSSVPSVIGGVIGLLSLVVCVAMIMAFTDKHMRIGKRTFNGLLSRLNDNLLSTFGVTVLLFVAYEVWALLSSSLFLLTAQLPFAVACVLIGVLYLVMHIGLLYSISSIYLWLPCMQITGFKPFEALRYANLLCEPIKNKLVATQLAVLLISEILIVLSVLCLPKTGVVSLLVATVLYAFMLMIFCVRMQIAYLARTQTERADLNKGYTV